MMYIFSARQKILEPAEVVAKKPEPGHVEEKVKHFESREGHQVCRALSSVIGQS